MITFCARSAIYLQLQPYVVLAALHKSHSAMMDTVKSLPFPQATEKLKTAIEGIVLQRCYSMSRTIRTSECDDGERCNPSGRTAKLFRLMAR